MSLIKEQIAYWYDITEQSSCLANVTEESRSNVCGIRDSRRIRETFMEAASRADCFKAAVNYVVDLSLIHILSSPCFIIQL